LFEHLSLEKQNLFISENKEKEDEGLAELNDEDTTEPEQESKMVRKNNRFTYFTQRGLQPEPAAVADVSAGHFNSVIHTLIFV
jgi:hypothetical protein